MTTSPRIRTIAKPATALAATLAVGALAAGCGGSDGGGFDGPQRSANDVAKQFKAVTGDALEVDVRNKAADVLSLKSTPGSGMSSHDRYGTFSIFVVHKGDGAKALSRLTRDDDGELEPDGQGIRWRQTPLGGYAATKQYGNVVLSWVADSRSADARFKRIDRVLGSLGKDPAKIRASLPVAEQPCASRGLDIAGTAQGVCRDSDGKQLRVVNRDTLLKLPQMSVQVQAVARVGTLPRRYRFEEPLQAKGQFVAAKLKVTNTGNEPLSSLYGMQLRIGDRYYDSDSMGGSRLEGLDRDFPLQPGESGEQSVVFDVPAPAAAQAAKGALMFGADDKDGISSVKYADKVAALRIGPAIKGSVTTPGTQAPRTDGKPS